MKISIPELSLIVLVGPSGSGKSSFAKKHFKNTEVISSDTCRGLVSDKETDQSVTLEAFELLHFMIKQRLKLGKLTVVDATNLQPESRKELVSIAKDYHTLPVCIVFKTPESVCKERNKLRTDREYPKHVVRNQFAQKSRGLKNLKSEGFRYIHTIENETNANNCTIERQPLWNNKRTLIGPFDIIGDTHGCYDELVELLKKLGYQNKEGWQHPEGRKVVFLGDLVDRGPKTVETLRLVMQMVHSENALCVPGNHDAKFYRWLSGKDVQIGHGLESSIAEIEALEKLNPRDTQKLKQQIKDFLGNLVSHYVLDDGKLCVAHAGMKESMMGRSSKEVREFALYGETTGETDEFGLPIRYNWAAEYRGDTIIAYGHTPVIYPEWINKTINIDTGCVYGGNLTALRYPELEIVSTPAKAEYAKASRRQITPEIATSETSQHQLDDILDLSDILDKRIINTRLRPNISIRQDNANAALEAMSRFSVNPKWLIYLPPTMSPTETSASEGHLEHPKEAFEYFRKRNIFDVICEEKHMGSRAIVVVCKDENIACKRFGIEDEGIGTIYTRTGRPFINNPELNTALLQRIHGAISEAGYWEIFNSDWFCLDCEFMPWSWKAEELIKKQYAATGTAAMAFTKAAHETLSATNISGIHELKKSMELKMINVSKYINTYRHYCWDATNIEDFKIAPFHILASEGNVHFDKTHEWHMSNINKLCQYDTQILQPTQHKKIDTSDITTISEGTRWWTNIISKGGEGMVVKPNSFIPLGKKDLLQPAIKCRGPEYLRLIYGPEYTEPKNFELLRNRNLRNKRSLALREFALGIESLERFIRKEPLRCIHECVFGILALESEPVDPRL